MDYCLYIRLKITPTNQGFISEETNQIISRGLQNTSDNFYFRLVENANGLRYYDCAAQISDNAFILFTDCRHYRWRVENEIILQQDFSATIRANKINEMQFTKLVEQINTNAV